MNGLDWPSRPLAGDPQERVCKVRFLRFADIDTPIHNSGSSNHATYKSRISTLSCFLNAILGFGPLVFSLMTSPRNPSQILSTSPFTSG
ncbi:hypothetical protein TRM7615_01754 [Falsiruegeria mediterranea M17]|uniref:Uncharacterized protein n=1 Tax=Falsiruegeria mediterranea M17 TaxID=1200281 RepID=A0A2R8C741_9RHOB|nr:hypothetical protein TRM7615_01754 [Falsiruegeria mediterranea M17]